MGVNDDLNQMFREVDPYELVAELHNQRWSKGMGVFQDRGQITAEEVRQEMPTLNRGDHIDYYHGRPLKLTIGDLFGSRVMYDRDAGAGTFQRCLEEAWLRTVCK